MFSVQRFSTRSERVYGLGFTDSHLRLMNGLNRLTFSEEAEHFPESKKSGSHRFQGFTRCDLHPLPGKGQNGRWAILHRIIAPIRRWIALKRPYLAHKKVLYHHDNPLAHTPHEFIFEHLPHSPYSPDLTTWNFFLFPNLKKSLAWLKFESNEEVIVAMEAYLAHLEKTYFLAFFTILDYFLDKCFEQKKLCWEIDHDFSKILYTNHKGDAFLNS